MRRWRGGEGGLLLLMGEVGCFVVSEGGFRGFTRVVSAGADTVAILF